MKCPFKFRGALSLLFKWVTAYVCLSLLGNWACSVLCLLCFVRVCLYVLRGHLLGKGWPLGSRLWCLLWVCHFPIGILGQVWYLIVSIPDLCNLTYFDKFFHTSAQMGISCIRFVLQEFWNTNSQNSQPTQFLRYFKYLLLIKLITKYWIWLFCIQFSVAMETVNPKIWCSSRFQKVNTQLECFIF